PEPLTVPVPTPVVSTPSEPTPTATATGLTTTPPPVSTPPEPSPGLTPPVSTPPDNRKICGPDITDVVLNTLRYMKNQFDANPAKQEAACRALFNPASYDYAWDIIALGPKNAPEKDMSYDPAADEWTGPPKKPELTPRKIKPWFTWISNM